MRPVRLPREVSVLTDELPNCQVCLSHDYAPGGSTLGGLLVQQGFRCQSCYCFVDYISARGGSVLTFLERSACIGPDQYGSYKFPSEYGNWMNKTVLPAWRAQAEKIEDFKSAEWRQWLTQVFHPAFPDCLDYVPHGTRTFYDLPDEAKLFIKNVWGESFNAGCYLPLPSELLEPVYPPAAPVIPGVHIMVEEGRSWAPLDYTRSAASPIVEDPILRRNREFFQEVWAQLARNIERDLPQVSKAKNEYGGIEPWYSFELGGAKFLIGWRKRVVSIVVDAPSGLAANDIRTLALADNTTYEAHGPLRIVQAEEFETHLRASCSPEELPLVGRLVESFRSSHPNGKQMRLEGGWKSGLETAHQIVVHAWGLDKTIEYLTLICRTLLLAGVSETSTPKKVS